MSTNVSVPPSNLEAERALLGGILRDPDIAPDVLAVVRPDALYFDCNRCILAAIADLTAQGKPVDMVTLHTELRQRKQLDDIGGANYITELWDAVPTGANALHHANLIREAALTRSLIHAANELLRDAYCPTMRADELLALMERRLYGLSLESAGDGAEPRQAGQVMRESLASLDDRITSREELAGLSTGYADLDKFTGGLKPGELIVLGARPSLGKTALSLNIAENVASAGTPVLFFSLEMTEREIGERLLAMDSGVPMLRLSRPLGLQQDDIDALCDAANNRHAVLPLYIDDAPDQSAARIASVSRRSCRKLKVKLIVVDYLQLMRPENQRENRTQQVGMLALRMKQMARSLNVPVLLLSQLNRELEHAKRRPQLADLRESGDIEAHADRVLFLHRGPDLPASDAVWPIEVIVAKNRNGPTGDTQLSYRRPVLRFENAAAGF